MQTLPTGEQSNQTEPRDPCWLLRNAHNVYTQFGEDGIIESLLDALDIESDWVVEFGAWDGVHLSNAKHIIDSRGFHAVMIEGDPRRCSKIAGNYPGNDRVHPVDAYVGFTQSDGLDSILAKTDCPKDFAFLSVDVDGNDYHIWKAVTDYRPKIVCIEYNPTIPNEVDFVQPADPKVNQGTAPKTLVELAMDKGYELVCVTRTNLFFVLKELFAGLGIHDNRLATLREDESQVTRIYCGYDGTIFLDGHARCPWNGMRIDHRKVQQIPRVLRKYPQCYTIWRRVLFRAFRYLPGFVRRKIC